MPYQVCNIDVKGICRRLSRMAIELNRSSSANSSGMKTFDKTRFISYLDGLSKYLLTIEKTQELDFPKSHPHIEEVEDFPVEPRVDNDDVNDLIALLKACYVELANSSSARDANKINPFDMQRLQMVLARCYAFVKDYIEVGTPVDFPETSPRDPLAPIGELGITK